MTKNKKNKTNSIWKFDFELTKCSSLSSCFQTARFLLWVSFWFLFDHFLLVVCSFLLSISLMVCLFCFFASWLLAFWFLFFVACLSLLNWCLRLLFLCTLLWFEFFFVDAECLFLKFSQFSLLGLWCHSEFDWNFRFLVVRFCCCLLCLRTLSFSQDLWFDSFCWNSMLLFSQLHSLGLTVVRFCLFFGLFVLRDKKSFEHSSKLGWTWHCSFLIVQKPNTKILKKKIEIVCVGESLFVKDTLQPILWEFVCSHRSMHPLLHVLQIIMKGHNSDLSRCALLFVFGNNNGFFWSSTQIQRACVDWLGVEYLKVSLLPDCGDEKINSQIVHHDLFQFHTPRKK